MNRWQKKASLDYLHLAIPYFALSLLCFNHGVIAEVTLDGSLGQTGELSGPDFKIRTDMGKQAGGNLFHSFEAFSVNTGESATFSGEGATGPVANILSRITGGGRSTIDGIIRTQFVNDAPNLFLLNPAGVLFGPNARLDVQGSFHVSSANYIRLGKNGLFHTDLKENTALTTSPPEAFGFLGDNPGSIDMDESQLGTPVGKQLSVVGGGTTIRGGILRTLSGRLDIVSVASPGEIATPAIPDVSEFQQLGRIEITDSANGSGAIVGTIGGGGTGIFIRGGIFTLGGGSQLSSATGIAGTETGGAISIETLAITIRQQSLLSTLTTGEKQGGKIVLEAKNLIVNDSFLETSTSGEGFAGDINVTSQKIDMNDSLLGSSTFNAGRSGAVNIQATDSIIAKGSDITSFTNSTGDAGIISIKTPQLVLDDSTLLADTNGQGKASDVFVDVATLILTNGGFIGTNTLSGAGKAGRIELTATDSISISGHRASDPTVTSAVTSGTLSDGDGGTISISTPHLTIQGGLISTDTFSQGNAGEIALQVGRLTVDDKGAVASRTFGSGKGGKITISAKEEVFIANEGSVIATTTGPNQGGNIIITAPKMHLSNGGRISAEGSSTGISGSLFINAVNSLRLENNGGISVATTHADAGSITLQVGDLFQLRDNSSITTSVAGGEGSGGNITIDPIITVLDGGSNIIARARRGNGGNILLVTDFLFQSSDSIIDASSQFGQSGAVKIDAPDTDILSGLTTLPANFFAPTIVLTKPCAQRTESDTIQLVKRKYEVLPDSPHALWVQLAKSKTSNHASGDIQMPMYEAFNDCEGKIKIPPQRAGSVSR